MSGELPDCLSLPSGSGACFNGAMLWVVLKVVHSKGCTVVWGGVGAEPVLGCISPAEVLKPAGTRQGIIPSVGCGW